jgi:hypothetical protein
MTENERIDYILNILSDDFAYVREDIDSGNRIRGIHPTGKTLFIDALIRPKNYDQWRNGNKTVFGIEFKKDHDKYGSLTKHIAQSIDYSMAKWEYNGRKYDSLPIIMSPRIVFERKIKYIKTDIDYFVPRLLGLYNIGMLDEVNHKHGSFIEIRFGESRLWSSDFGVTELSKSFKFERKIGSR